MTQYVLRRILALVPVLLLITLVVFLVMDLVPGDAVDAIASQAESGLSVEDKERIRQELGLNDPLPVRYARWLADVLRGDFGTSIWSGQPVLSAVLDRFPSTLELTVASIGVAVVIGFALGTIAALTRGGPLDTLAMGIAIVGVSIPVFWLGLLLLLGFAVRLQWFPVIGQAGLGALVLPAFTLGIKAAGVISRLVRSGLIEVMSQDYIRTAHAKGLRYAQVVRGHAFKNALIPVVTVVGLQFGSLLAGAVIVEAVFARRGIGELIVSAIQARDYPVVQGAVLFTALVYVFVNLAVDILYGFLDPRIRYS